MSRRSSWSWRRRIDPARSEEWIAKMPNGAAWVITEKPNRVRALLSVHVESRAEAERLRKQWGGQARLIKTKDWIQPARSSPVRISAALQIIHEKPARRKKGAPAQLYIPHGLAFGSGEHATTVMLLRALARERGMARRRVLDLGTGSGILALAARHLGASRITATDLDGEAVRTARANEARNFPAPLIRWQRGDVRTLKTKTPFDLVVANLFSGILCEAAQPITEAVAPGGQLWLSGILREQGGAVAAAYRARKMVLTRTIRRGKWLLLLLKKPEV
jgi:ribosomal protein L11 methyltransferase